MYLSLVLSQVKSAVRHLPEDRSKVVDPEFGYLEPVTIPPGRCSLRQALEFISLHQTEPEIHTVDKIAQNYYLEMDKVDSILKYFHMYQLHIPKGLAGSELLDPMEATALKPSTLQKMLTAMGRKDNQWTKKSDGPKKDSDKSTAAIDAGAKNS